MPAPPLSRTGGAARNPIRDPAREPAAEAAPKPYPTSGGSGAASPSGSAVRATFMVIASSA